MAVAVELEFETVANGLDFPEGPVVLGDGSILVVEIFGGTLARITADGAVSRPVRLGGGPNGAATGPDGAIYVCNNGGMAARKLGGEVVPAGDLAPDYSGGRIERVDLASGTATILYDACEGVPLYSPNDIVFDRHGGFWFTDHGKKLSGERTPSGIFYAQPGGGQIRCLVRGPQSFNGIGLSPDEATLYVADTFSGRLLRFDVSAPGILASAEPTLVVALGEGRMVDSLAVGADGAVHVGALMPGGIVTVHGGVITGDHRLPDPYVTNIAFGGDDMATAYITLSQTGRLVRARGIGTGLPLNFG
ncbi:SMP-30/gluconolactonase/LRE family protein [Sphingomonas immobilis]|uniref:SMP-30/gluconolactonase/LRE family protein n=1 Tax=Sphingomonas immobilis TaxID=3063997 RepID=A0ABT8ZYU0_9SPHN|nr:SMP-30/gluconolactonase/LRE family protein [Sphingomonas sp. CA1-15]MDO7842150.1 SMP-30/gluconolactonase/LRE family protein [Sphingomonas sp. CA1-15]